MNNYEIKKLLEEKKYIISVKEYLQMTEDMNDILYLAYKSNGNYFSINIKNLGEYNFKVTRK